jgi:hypothetical protein
MTRERGNAFQVSGFVAVAILSALSWFGWMGWDGEYRIVDGEQTGPYEAWQVAGCVLSLLVILVGALLLGVRPWLAAPALILAFTTSWTVQAAGRDDSGLYPVGALALLIGLTAGAALVSAVVVPLRAARLARR